YRFRLAFGGGLSSINPNTTWDMYLHLGGFSAEYGNSLSSILEVESRLGNRNRIRAQGTFNFTDVNGVIDGPLPYGIGSFLVSVRRTYYDFIANGISESNSAFPFYFEINNKLTFDLSKSNRLILSFTRNREGTELLNEFSDELNLTEDATSYIGSLAWRKYHGEKWQFNTVFSYYSDDIKYRAFTIDTLDQEEDYEALDSRVVNYAFKTNIRYKTGDESWLNWGFTTTRIPSDVNFEAADLSFLYARVESPRDIKFDDTYNYYATYLESSTKATEKLHLRIGARYDHSSLIDEGELSPRFSIWYQFNDRTSIEGSWGLFYQYPDPAAVYTRNIPVDLSENLGIISAEKSTHQILSIQHDFSSTLSAKLQLYNKD
ncbi:TonB-dependent receptor, partial [candidate division KSB1 bacterium]|nr:TonB-dependent receptor [candidate division KSB1 bacterium]NIR71204.1 TonB-dependent receptor [candidate division KSB1 bacterium]NIS27923.1 TonB-dependent receptor [candidate division KSB1 bacterium]NIT74806.1 TonB-dependent receptor [candidate division KSB1 bacterium]NIU28582.1 TonB-dependent receptor [candidate division KSB1 bacterium]